MHDQSIQSIQDSYNTRESTQFNQTQSRRDRETQDLFGFQFNQSFDTTSIARSASSYGKRSRESNLSSFIGEDLENPLEIDFGEDLENPLEIDFDELNQSTGNYKTNESFLKRINEQDEQSNNSDRDELLPDTHQQIIQSYVSSAQDLCTKKI